MTLVFWIANQLYCTITQCIDSSGFTSSCFVSMNLINKYKRTIKNKFMYFLHLKWKKINVIPSELQSKCNVTNQTVLAEEGHVSDIVKQESKAFCNFYVISLLFNHSGWVILFIPVCCFSQLTLIVPLCASSRSNCFFAEVNNDLWHTENQMKGFYMYETWSSVDAQIPLFLE